MGHSRNSTVVSSSHLQLVIGGPTSITLVALGTVELQFRGALVPVSSQPLLRIVAAPGSSLVTMQLPSPLGVLVSIRQLTGCGSEYYIQPLRTEVP